MGTALPEGTPSSVVAFRDARWKTRWIVIGLTVLLLWQGARFIDRQSIAHVPLWLLMTITGFAPQAFLLVYPILTRNPNHPSTFGVQSATRCLIEFGIAILTVPGILIVLAAINSLVLYFAPEIARTPDPITNFARSSANPMLVYFMLLFSFTFAPVAEEVFFRGFLFNAFRVRMPVIFAALAQSLIFGFGHFFGATHAGYAFAIGLLLTAIYEWRKTLITPIVAHAGINFVAALGTLLTMIAHANSPVMGVIGDPKDPECVIRQIAPNSPAEDAGLQPGDIVTSFNTEPIRDFPHLVQTTARYRPGDAIPVTINRSGTVMDVTVVLQRRGNL